MWRFLSVSTENTSYNSSLRFDYRKYETPVYFSNVVGNGSKNIFFLTLFNISLFNSIEKYISLYVQRLVLKTH